MPIREGGSDGGVGSTLTWELPTERTDGTPLAPEELQAVIVIRGEVEWPQAITNGDPMLVWPPYDSTSAECSDLGTGTFTVRVAVLDYQMLTSDPSNEVTCSD